MSYDLHSIILLNSLVAAVSDVKTETKVRGGKEEVEVMIEVVEATKSFRKALDKPDAKLEEVTEALTRRQKAAAEFFHLTGLAWPL